MKPVRDCPCCSGLRYSACCAPRHTGATPAETPEALMRSRYAAFVVGLGEYLVDTLASDHEDRAIPRAALAQELSNSRHKQRFMGLEIVAAEGDWVLFVARVFTKGRDDSFGELSTFRREDGTWRYASGMLTGESRLPADRSLLTREAFVELARTDPNAGK